MRDIVETSHPVLAHVRTTLDSGAPVALVTLVDRTGSAPRPVGAMMSVHVDGSVVGSISGGCVEAAVYESALEVLSTGTARTERYGPDGDPVAPGLTCGGALTVFIERQTPDDLPTLREIVASLVQRKPIRLITTIDDAGATIHTTAPITPITAVDTNTPVSVSIEASGDRIHTITRTFLPAPRMIIVGSTVFASETATVGARMGYHVTVCDARPLFTTAARLPDAHEVICRWPSDYLAAERDSGRIDGPTAVVVLTHDPKIDIPVLIECLDDRRWSDSPSTAPFYVGAMGSQTAVRRRRQDLSDAGITDAQLARLHSPIGLDLGNTDAAGTAISIAAQIISERRAPESDPG